MADPFVYPKPPGLWERWRRRRWSPQQRLTRALAERSDTDLRVSLAAGADVHAPGAAGLSPLATAARDGWFAGLLTLLASGARPNDSMPDGLSVLERAAPHGLGFLTALIQNGASVLLGPEAMARVEANLPPPERTVWRHWMGHERLGQSLPPAVSQAPRRRL